MHFRPLYNFEDPYFQEVAVYTKFNADEFEVTVAEKQLILDVCEVKYIPNHGSLDKWQALFSWEPQHHPLLIHASQ